MSSSQLRHIRHNVNDRKSTLRDESDWLTRYIKSRLRNNMDVRILVTGPGGIGKSWFSLRVAELIDPRFTKKPQEAVEKQVCFKAETFMAAVTELPTYSVIIYDEPGQTFFSREFMSEANRVLAKTIIGFRFKRFATFFAVPALSMIDKTARELCNLKIDVTGHGYAEVYDIMPSRFYDNVWYGHRGHINVGKPSVALRHIYEQKKARIQDAVYKEYQHKLDETRIKNQTDDELIKRVLEHKQVLTKDDRLVVARISGKFRIGRDRATRIREQIEMDEGG